MNCYNTISMEKLVIQSTKDNITRAEELIYDICVNNHVENYYGVISVAVLQAVENAIIHGNHCDKNKLVRVECGNCKGGMFFEIKDEGEGFASERYGELPIEGEKGDGIFLMKTLSDKIVYSENGSRVRMEFVISGIESDECKKRCSVLDEFFMPKLVDA